MRRVLMGALIGLAAALTAGGAWSEPSEASRWRAEAAAVTIVRDDWGVAHVHGRTDAEAVFGMIYAEAEDDFHRIENNYVTALGRQAEVQGERAVYQDLRMRLFVDPLDLRLRYAKSPAPLKKLMNAWADALNFYLSTHPQVKPMLIKRFEPWMSLSFTEGSIGLDTERVSLKDVERFYGGVPITLAAAEPWPRFKEPTGSNAIAIAPANTADHHALLLINPHTPFFFREEIHVTSNEGLNAYGAATWGQPFIYQGFNDKIGWAHTASGVDSVDEFAETVVKKAGGWFYRYGGQLRPVITSVLAIPYKTPTGMGRRAFTVYRTHHGPIVRERDGKWVAVALMNRPVEAMSQDFLLSKARDYPSFLKALELKANSSNNTIYADVEGNIAYQHPQFIPRRDDRFDYTHPVDGSDPATDWRGLLALNEAPHLFNPASGWIFNTNNWPWSAAGYSSPKRSAYPKYMDQAGENPRGQHATQLLSGKKGWTAEGLNAAAYDSYLPAFAETLPSLFRSYDGADEATKVRLKEPVGVLRAWNFRFGTDSVATSLAVFWGEALWTKVEAPARRDNLNIYDYMANHSSSAQKLEALTEAVDKLKRDFGAWKTPWGEINRFQRNDGEIVQRFDDAKPSVAVPFTSARWGSLASFGARPYGTRKWYGTSGNSFVAVVEFGPRIKARAVTAGGESGDPDSDHFDDQAERYASGRLREVYFYPDQLKGHTERTYHPGK